MSIGNAQALQLRNGSRIAIIGGGPAGCFFALNALDIARQRGLRLQIIIFERKDFTRRGPSGCNKCAGILSSHLLQNLGHLRLTLPPQVIMNQIQTYVLHLEDAAVEISQPEPSRRIVSVYRSVGPRLGDLSPNVSFDSWLLGEAQQRGAQLIREQVREVRMANRPIILTRTSTLTCDLVVLATGVNSQAVKIPDLKYVPPATEIMSQDELVVSGMRGDERIHIFLGHSIDAFFVSLTPKGRFVSISMLGQSLAKDNIGQFLTVDQVQMVLMTKPRRVCGCNPRIVVSPAVNFYADRFVAVGDAAVTRLYKDGIGSAFLTARRAAQIALEVGVSEADFCQRYAPFCQRIHRDNRIGRLLFTLWSHTQRSRRLSQAWLKVLLAEEGLVAREQHGRQAMWGLLTGDDSYQAIVFHLFNLKTIFRFLIGFFRPKTWAR